MVRASEPTADGRRIEDPADVRISSMPPGRLRTPPVAAAPAAPAAEPEPPPGRSAPAQRLVEEADVVAHAAHPWPELPAPIASHDVELDVALRAWGREQRLDREQAGF